MTDITVLGSGSWGTALALLLARKNIHVNLVVRNRELLKVLQDSRENKVYLKGFLLPENISISSLDEAPGLSCCTVVAVPSHNVKEMINHLPSSKNLIIVASKGLVSDKDVFISKMLQMHFPLAEVGVLSGPNLALELAHEIPSAAVAASANLETAQKIASIFRAPHYRIYTSTDIIGVELSGALKNIYAIGAGMSDGLGFGDNTKATLLARGLHEMTRLGLCMNAKLETFMGIAGVGDLFATASSKLSRNYRVGSALGQGKTLQGALEEIGQVAEGVNTSKLALELSQKHQIAMPILEAIESVLFNDLSPRQAVGMLMERGPKHEGFSLPESECLESIAY